MSESAISYQLTEATTFCPHSLAYSARRESIGFKLAARIDGMRLAATVTTASRTAAPANVAGSRGFNPKRSALAALAAASDRPAPSTSPIASSVPALPSIMAVMLARRAPRAMRIPISVVRSATVYDITP